MGVSKSQQIDVKIAGGSMFARYGKIDISKTFNMFVSDGWLINYAGFKKRNNLSPVGKGRGFFNSIRGGFLIAVVGADVYKLGIDLVPNKVGTLDTTSGDVFIDENLSGQICIVDGQAAYIYNDSFVGTNFVKQTVSVDFKPSYVCYHGTFFLIGSSKDNLQSADWYVYDRDTDTTIKKLKILTIQTKPDSALIVQRLPGRGNNVLVVGSTVAEVWTLVGGTQFYVRVQSFNIDNGVASIASLAANEDYICFLAQNENNSPFIMVTDGSSSKRISTDGIDHVLDQIKFPKESTAFFYRQDGHLFYQITFYNPVDNLSLIYDFTTQMFCHVSDQNLNYHPAKKIVFFNEQTYFVSLNDGSVYQMDTDLLTYDYDTDKDSIGDEIPRIRICNTIRKPDSDRFRASEFTFWIEQGVVPENAPTPARVDMSVSKNGNQSFSNVVSKELNAVGNYRNQIRWWRLGQANEFTIQLRFYGFQRFVVTDGKLSAY